MGIFRLIALVLSIVAVTLGILAFFQIRSQTSLSLSLLLSGFIALTLLSVAAHFYNLGNREYGNFHKNIPASMIIGLGFILVSFILTPVIAYSDGFLLSLLPPLVGIFFLIKGWWSMKQAK